MTDFLFISKILRREERSIMLKKAIACLLVLAGVCSFHTSAADSKNEQFVNVNVFNKVYYGTVTTNADAGEAIFTPAGKVTPPTYLMNTNQDDSRWITNRKGRAAIGISPQRKGRFNWNTISFDRF